MLTASVARVRWLAGHLVLALAGAAVVLAAGGLGTGASYAVAVGDAGQVVRVAVAALAHVPAVGLDVVPLAVLGTLAAVLVVAGLTGFSRRDLA